MSIYWGIRHRAGAAGSPTHHGSEHELRQLSTKVEEVETRLDRLTLICMALWKLLEERAGYSEKELTEYIRKVDLLDGKLDGQVKIRRVLECSSCGRVMSPRHIRCLYCGAEKEQLKTADGVFDLVT